MNDTLSPLIAFVGFLIVFSMLIQSVQEALKNLFKLKAGVWEKFFITLYRTDFQGRSPLPGTSFWKRITSAPFVGEFDQRLMRLKNVIIKADQWFKEIKEELLTGMALDFSDLSPGTDAFLKLDRICCLANQISGLKIDAMLTLYETNRKEKIQDLLIRFRQKTKAIETTGGNDIASSCQDLYLITKRLESAISTYRVQIENKADAWLVQLQGEYKKNMLKWTLIISVFAVVLLNADSFSIYKHFSPKPDARTLLLKSEDQKNADTTAELERIHTLLSRGDLENAKSRLQTISARLSPLSDTPVGKHYAPTEQLIKAMEASELPLGWGQDWEALSKAEGGKARMLVIKKIFGLTLTIFLVSFGAPFWKNIMNALIGLKHLSPQTKSRA